MIIFQITHSKSNKQHHIDACMLQYIESFTNFFVTVPHKREFDPHSDKFSPLCASPITHRIDREMIEFVMEYDIFFVTSEHLAMKFGLAYRQLVKVGYFWQDKISKKHWRGKQVVFLLSIKRIRTTDDRRCIKQV